MIDVQAFIPSNKWIAFVAYWVPFIFCSFGYIVRTCRNYKNDRQERLLRGNSYSPTDTIGTLIGRGLITIIPLANVCAALFDLSPEIFGKFFKWLSRVFNQPLVPRLKNDNQSRK
jgi:hypothetical protein